MMVEKEKPQIIRLEIRRPPEKMENEIHTAMVWEMHRVSGR